MNDQAGQGEWRIRAQFYSSTGADLGYQTGCYDFGKNTLTWEQVICYVTTPANAATMRLQVWLVQHSGWVAVDDLTVDDLTVDDPNVPAWDGITKYYTFNGQRIALRGATGLVYLHTDHLGSTKLVTDQDGNPVQAPTQYYVYGREQAPGSVAGLPTDYTFTGQRLDNTGLVYMNARYYDPELGQFLSPDTLIPDPSNVFAYNRYMYGLGNPMLYTDPTGHCALAAAMGPSGLAFDIPCWTLGPGEVAALAGAGALAGAAAAPAVVNYVLNEPPLDYPPLYPTLGQDVGKGNISITIPVPSSTTVTSGVPLTSGPQTASTGATALNNPVQQLIDPLPTKGNLSLIYASSQQGWRVGDPITNLTAKGTLPSWSAVRSRYWKNEAYYHPEDWTQSALERMQQGLAPQRINPLTGKLESMELHHNPAQRTGGLFEVEPLWPDDHADIDPYRRTGN